MVFPGFVTVMDGPHRVGSPDLKKDYKMRFTKTLLIATTALTLSTTLLQAQQVSDQLITELQGLGYTRIEIKEGLTQVKVEAVKDGTKLEYVYDINSGEILYQSTETVEAGDDTSPGIEVRSESRDFVGANGRRDDDSYDDDSYDDDDDDSYDDDDHDDDHGDDHDDDDDHEDDDDDRDDDRHDDHGDDDSDDGDDD